MAKAGRRASDLMLCRCTGCRAGIRNGGSAVVRAARRRGRHEVRRALATGADVVNPRVGVGYTD